MYSIIDANLQRCREENSYDHKQWPVVFKCRVNSYAVPPGFWEQERDSHGQSEWPLKGSLYAFQLAQDRLQYWHDLLDS